MRPTNLAAIARMYCAGLGFTEIGSFDDHQGFDGRILGHPEQPYHLEFTSHRGHAVGGAPSEDNLLVFYLPDEVEWATCCERMVVLDVQHLVHACLAIRYLVDCEAGVCEPSRIAVSSCGSSSTTSTLMARSSAAQLTQSR